MAKHASTRNEARYNARRRSRNTGYTFKSYLVEGFMTADKTAQTDEEFFRQRGFGLRIGFGDRPALLVIDLIKAFTDAGKMPVIFSTVIYQDADFKDAGIWALKQKGVVTLKAGTSGVELDPRLKAQKTDTLLMKKYASCFFGTDLVSRLLAHRIDTLLIAGCTTSGCVRATAVDACQTGFRPMVVREAVGDRSAAAHDQSLFDLDAKYADVVSLADTLEYLVTIGRTVHAATD